MKAYLITCVALLLVVAQMAWIAYLVNYVFFTTNSCQGEGCNYRSLGYAVWALVEVPLFLASIWAAYSLLTLRRRDT